MSKRAVLYARVSTDEQAKGYSLQTQLDAGRRYANAHGYSVVESFQDDYTGASLDRPDLNRLREFIREAGDICVVIVYDVDRIARKSVYQMLIEEELRRLGAKVEYVTGQYADTDEGQLQKQIRGAIAEYEKAKILERSKRGKRGKAQSGFVLPGARTPYGYRVRSEPHKAWLEVDEEEAKIVRLVFQWYLLGDGQSNPLSMNEIAIRLTKMQIPTRGDKVKHVAKKRGFGVWTAGMVRHILINETYTGTWHFGKTCVVSPEEARKIRPDGKPRKEPNEKNTAKRGFGVQVARPREEWVAVNVPAIIDRSALEATRERITQNQALAKRCRKHAYLLGGRLKCTKCGYSYVGRTRNERSQYYYCKGREQIPVKLCDMPTFQAGRVDEIVWNWVKNILEHPDQLGKGLRSERAEAEQKYGMLRERLKLIDSQLAEMGSRIGELLDEHLAKHFPKALLDSRKAQLDKSIADLNEERADVAGYLVENVITEEQIIAIEAEIAEIGDGLDFATFDDKRRYFDLLKVRGKLAIEEGEKVIYISCRFKQQQLSLAPTSP